MTAFELSAIPIAGVALAYFSRNRFEALDGLREVHGGVRNAGFAVLAFVFVTLAFVFAGLFDVLRIGVATSDQLAFLRPAYSPFDAASFDLFFPALFAVAFYMMGRRLKRAMYRTPFVLSVSLAGFLGSLVGGVTEASLLGEPLPLASPGLFVGSAELGILVLALGTTTVLVGYMRSPNPAGSTGSPVAMREEVGGLNDRRR